MKRLNYFLWYFFFSAYWTAYELGEKRNPKSNASYLLSLNIGWNLFGLFQILLLFGYQKPTLLLIGLCLIPAVFIPYFLTNNKKEYLKKNEEFAYLKNIENKRARYILLISITLWSIAFVAIVAVLRNIYQTN